MTSPLDVVQIPSYPGMWARRCVVDAWIAAGRPPINSAGRTYEQQKQLYDLWRAGKGSPADNPDSDQRLPHVRGLALDIGRSDALTVSRMATAGFTRPITKRKGTPWPDGLGGFSGDENWHHELKKYVLIPRSVPKVTKAQAENAIPYESTAGSGGSKLPKEDKVTPYHREDLTARKVGRIIKPGQGFYLHTTLNAPATNATNVIGGVGVYDILAHIYASGKPGDKVSVVAVVQTDPASKTPGNSRSYTQRFTLEDDGSGKGIGDLADDAGWKLDLSKVTKPTAIYIRAEAPAANKADVKVTVLDSDAHLFVKA